MTSFRLRPLCLWERGPDVIWRWIQVSFGGGLDVWRKDNSCLSLESKHDSSVLQLVAYGWAVLVGICFQPDGLYFSLLKLCENHIQGKIHYEIVWLSCFFIIQRTYEPTGHLRDNCLLSKTWRSKTHKNYGYVSMHNCETWYHILGKEYLFRVTDKTVIRKNNGRQGIRYRIVIVLRMMWCTYSTNVGVEKCKQNLFDETNAETMKRGKRCIWKRINP